MPCIKCKNDKWRIGSGKCVYSTKAVCERAMKAYYAKQDKKRKK